MLGLNSLLVTVSGHNVILYESFTQILVLSFIDGEEKAFVLKSESLCLWLE